MPPFSRALLAAACAALLATGCASPPETPRASEADASSASTTAAIESLLNMSQWSGAAQESRETVAERVRALRRRPGADLLAFFRTCHGAAAPEPRDDERAVLNLARFLEGTWRTPGTGMRGVFLHEHRGLTWLNERAPDSLWLDSYETLPNPLVLPEPALPLLRIEPDAAAAAPPIRELLTKLIELTSPLEGHLEHSDASGLGLEIGLHARRDPSLAEWLLATARRTRLSPIARDVFAAAMATARIREAEPLLREWLLEVLRFSEESRWTDRRQTNRMRALRLLAGGPAVAEVRRDAERSLPPHRVDEVRAMALDARLLEEALGLPRAPATAEGVASIARVLAEVGCNREALDTETVLRCAERAVALAETWKGREEARHACDVAWLLIHPREGVEARPLRVFEGEETAELRRRLGALRRLLSEGKVGAASGRRFVLESIGRDVLRWSGDVLLPPDPGMEGERLWIHLWHPTSVNLDASRIEGGFELKISNHGTTSVWFNLLAWEHARTVRRLPIEDKDQPAWWEVRVGELLDLDTPRLRVEPAGLLEIRPRSEARFPVLLPSAPPDAQIRILYDDRMEVEGLPAGLLLRRFAFELSPYWVKEVQFE